MVIFSSNRRFARHRCGREHRTGVGGNWRAGFDLIAASSALDAAAAADHHPCDLLVTNLTLPDASGAQLLQWLRARGNVPGIAITGAADQEATMP